MKNLIEPVSGHVEAIRFPEDLWRLIEIYAAAVETTPAVAVREIVREQLEARVCRT